VTNVQPQPSPNLTPDSNSKVTLTKVTETRVTETKIFEKAPAASK